MDLSKLSPAAGSRKVRRRIGRGNASGCGRTAGRGEKGQMARTGGSIRPGFEGGQMPLYRRLPKFGFSSRKKALGTNRYEVIGLSVLDKFENGATVDPQALRERAGIRPGSDERAGIKVLANGALSKKLTVRVHAVTKSAREKIEALGGTVELLTGSSEN